MNNSETGRKFQAISSAGLTALMLITDSTYLIFARMLQAYLPAQQATLYTTLAGTLLVVGYAIIKKRFHFKVLFDNLGFFMLIGLLIALASNLTYVAVNYIDPGTASILNQSTIIFGLVWGLVWLHEKFSRRQAIGAVIAIAGVVVITMQKGDYLRLGSLLVVLASLSYSFHSAVVKKYGNRFDFLEFFSFRLICNCLFLFIWVLMTTGLSKPSAAAWPVIILVGVVDICIGRTLYYAVLRKIPISILSLLLTLSPILTIIWSLIVFGTFPTWIQLIGGVVVISGMLVMAGFPGRLRKLKEASEPTPEEIAEI